jgi:hypothetical protein
LGFYSKYIAWVTVFVVLLLLVRCEVFLSLVLDELVAEAIDVATESSLAEAGVVDDVHV